MKKLNLLLAATALAVACSGPVSNGTANVANRTENIVGITEGQPVATADLSISGMTCEMMCGSMIRSALVKVPGVEKTEVAFHDGDALGHAKVTYDPAKVNDAELVKTVQALADGQYKVEAIAVVKQVLGSPSADKGAAKEKSDASASLLPEVHMPNLLSTLLSLVRM